MTHGINNMFATVANLAPNYIFMYFVVLVKAFNHLER